MSVPRAALLPGLGAGIAALAALHGWRGVEYWNYSEGVYAFTSRLLINGHDIYGQLVAAQPPWQFFVGGALLLVHDSLPWLRLGVGGLQLAAGVLAMVITWRLTGSRLAAAAAAPLMLLTPWALHEHGALTPETVAAPMLLGAVLLAGRGNPVAAGLLASVAVFTKWPFALAAMAIVVAAPRRRHAIGALVAGVGVQALAFTAIFGTGFWVHTVEAQLHSGSRPIGMLAGVWGQALWSLSGLLVATAIGIAAHRKVRDPALFLVAGAAALGLLLTIVTNAKHGTGLNILVPVEAALVPLALAGAAVATGGLRAVAVAAILFALVQSTSLLTTNPTTATPFLYPGSEKGAWAGVADDDHVRAEEKAARACPPGVIFNGHPFYAFVAERPMPADQPDQFLTRASPTLSEYIGPQFAVTERCP